MKLFLSIRPARRGGGSNTFAVNAARWAAGNRCKLVTAIEDADVAVVIAHCGVTEESLRRARDRNCFVVHRIDEHFGRFTDGRYIDKHEKIKRFNAYADVTVFQSEWVRRTALPHLGSANHVVILNGADPARFRPGRTAGCDVGHLTWGTIDKKRLDLVHEAIQSYPDEHFRLVGRHRSVTDPDIDFNRRNVSLRGERNRRQIPAELRKMKVLFFPSENDPCPNTVAEAILCGVPVCYSDSGGTPELVRDCGEPLDRFPHLLEHLGKYRERCLGRTDLAFDDVMRKYEALWQGRRN
tara:strand:+ start:109 stop:996 length:888 start_codon:yes stop_codon:yes gene_type:complete